MLTPQFDLYRNIATQLFGKRVLEVGFGTGFGTLQLAVSARMITACEPDREAVNFAKMVLPLPNVFWVEADITGNARQEPLYDAVVMVETLEHIADWRKALTNIHGLLKPGGCLYMTARNRNADLRRNDLHEREWSATELANALGEFFLEVKLYDYTLQNEQTTDTHITPLIAVARKAGGHGEDIRSDVSKGWEQGRAAQTYTGAGWETHVAVDVGSGAAEQISH